MLKKTKPAARATAKLAKDTPKSAKSFIEEVTDVASQIAKTVREGSAQAVEAAGPGLERANEFVHQVTAAAGPKLSETTARLQDTADKIRSQEGFTASPRLQELTEKGRQQAAQAGEKASAYASKVAADAQARIADGSTKVAGLLATANAPKAVEDLATRVTGDSQALKKVQKAAAKGAENIAKKAAKSTKEVAKANKGRGAWNWVIWVLVLGAVGGIAYFVWKKAQPVNDPWSQPLPGNRPADAKPLGSHDAEEATAPVVSQVAVPAAKTADEEGGEDGERVLTSDGAVADDVIDNADDTTAATGGSTKAAKH